MTNKPQHPGLDGRARDKDGEFVTRMETRGSTRCARHMEKASRQTCVATCTSTRCSTARAPTR